MMKVADKVVFAESCVPPLRSGEYKLDVSQTEDFLGQSKTEIREFSIQGPRFGLKPDDVVGVYPPEGMTGSFALSLPHVIFRRRTLPWERGEERMIWEDGSSPEGVAPWLALILLRGSEIEKICTGTVNEVVSPAGGEIYFPELSVGKEEAGEICQYIELDTQMFHKIMPMPTELTLLAHARRSNTKLQAVRESRTDEWVSLLVGNRFPADSAEGVHNRAYVVSLEGFGDYSGIRGAARVRLIVLKSWEFYAVTENWHLKEMFQALDMGPLTPVVSQDMGSRLQAVLKNGYLPMLHTLRNGELTVSFYRGPFAPVKVMDRKYKASDADMLYRYDRENGVFDVSYASAWQQGRLITLNNPSIAVKIMRARSKNHAAVHSFHARKMLFREFMGAECGSCRTEAGTQISWTEGQKTMGQTLLEYLEKRVKEES